MIVGSGLARRDRRIEPHLHFESLSCAVAAGNIPVARFYTGLHNGESEANSSGVAVTRELRSVERIEDAVQVLLGNTWS